MKDSIDYDIEQKEKRENTFRAALDEAIEAGMQAEDGDRAKAIYEVMEERGYGYLSIGNIGMYLPMELKQKLIEEGY